MQLHEAMRLGAVLGPQVFGKLWNENSDDGSSCAIGSVLRSIGADKWKISSGIYPKGFTELVETFPVLITMVTHPFGGHADKLWDIIIELNNYHMWSRERIAVWVQTIENPVPVTEEVLCESRA